VVAPLEKQRDAPLQNNGMQAQAQAKTTPTKDNRISFNVKHELSAAAKRLYFLAFKPPSFQAFNTMNDVLSAMNFLT
jgi:hypothetical protein